ncbi:phytoene desaturase family protein [Domibacillus indicus]|uniref:phytoene desaturase family protein n=1 Tax=Domibacillus indicus TaxID=1437523 RepID=UPI0009E322F6|nr:phytoene desaturase family protein [Domibacillus indicus]
MKAVIAGGGIGGMIGALLLKKQGMDVTIVEKEQCLGGRLQYAKHDQFKIDKGPTIVLLPDMFRTVMRRAGIGDSEYELIRLDPLYDIHYENGKTYTKYAEEDRQLEEIERVFPGESPGFSRFMSDMRGRFQKGSEAFLSNPFLTKSSFFNIDTLSSLIKMKAYKNVAKGLSHYFTDPDLINAYALQTLYIGGNPYATPSIYSLVSFSEHEHGVYYVKGGYASIVELLERHLRKSGIKVQYNTPVDRVLLDGPRAEGVQSKDRKVKGDLVVLNSDFPGAEELLGRKKRRYIPSSGCFLLYLGLNKKYEDKKIHQFYLSNGFRENMKAVFQDSRIPDDPSLYVFYPSIIDQSLAPKGKSVMYVLVPVPSGEMIDWEKEKNKLSHRVITILEKRGFAGLRKAIEWMEIRTPQEARTEGLYGGGSFGIAPALSQSGIFRPQVKVPGFDNVYAAGASVHPGGGVPIVMQGALMMADVIAEEYKTELERRRNGDEYNPGISNL